MTAKELQDEMVKVTATETTALGKVQAAEKTLARAKKELNEVRFGDGAKALLSHAIALTAAAGLPVPENLSTVPLTASKTLIDPLVRVANAQRYAAADVARANSKPAIIPQGKYRLLRDVVSGGQTFAKYTVIGATALPPGLMVLLIDQRRAVPVPASEAA